MNPDVEVKGQCTFAAQFDELGLLPLDNPHCHLPHALDLEVASVFTELDVLYLFGYFCQLVVVRHPPHAHLFRHLEEATDAAEIGKEFVDVPNGAVDFVYATGYLRRRHSESAYW